MIKAVCSQTDRALITPGMLIKIQLV